MNNTRQTYSNPQSFLGRVLTDIFQLMLFGILGAVFFLVRYMLRTPQLLQSEMIGEDRLFHWTHGHIFYKVAGVEDAPPLVLIHAPELAASSYEMRGIIELLAQHYRVYALDLLGFGLSDHPHMAYTGNLYVSLLHDFLTRVVQRPATLVASGLSANYAIALASSNPEQCERLVLLSPTNLFANDKVHHWYMPLLRNPLVGLCLYAFLTTRVVLYTALTRGASQAIAALSPRDMHHYFAAAHQFGAEHPVLSYMTGDLALDVSHQLETLRQPLLVIWGLHAMQRTLHSAQAIASLQEGASSPLLALTSIPTDATDAATPVVLLPDAGLHVQEEQPSRVASLILDWTTGTIKSEIPSQENIETDDYEKQETSLIVSPSTSVAPSTSDSTTRIDTSALEALERQEVAQGVAEADLPQDEPPGEAIEAYCVKCKQKRIMSKPTDTTTKNGRRAKEGTCPVCGTRLFRFIAS